MSKLKDMVDDVYVESFTREVVDNYFTERGYEPLSDERLSEVVDFAQKLVRKFNVESNGQIKTASMEDKKILDSYLAELLDVVISLFSFIVIFKGEEQKLHRDIDQLKEQLND